MKDQELTVLEKFLSDKIGVVKNLHTRKKEGLYLVNSETPNYELFPGVEDSFNFWAGATETSLENAKKKTIAETLERYSMLMPQSTKSRRVEEAVQKTPLTLEHISWFNNKQSVKYEQPREGDKLEFIEGTTLNGEDILFPARLLVNNYQDKRTETVNIGYPTTSGCATGFEYRETLKRGIMEQVERDGVLSTWFSQDSLTEIELSEKEENLAENYLGDKVSEYHIIDATSDLGVPTFLGVCYNRDSGIGPAWSFSSALNRDEALEDTLLELAQSWESAVIRSNNNSTGYPGNSFDKLDKLVSRIETKEVFNGESMEFSDLIDRIKRKSISVYFFDISAPELSAEGLKVTRTIMPELVQFGSFYAIFLGNRRFEENYEVEKCLENKPSFLH